MTPLVRNAIIGFAVAVVVGAGLGAIGGGFYAGFCGLLLGVFTWYILSNLSSNRAVTNVSDADRQAALTSPALPGCGIVYIYREGFVGMAVGFDVALDLATVAQLKSPRFTRLNVPAGNHTLAAGPKGFAGSQNRSGAIGFAIVAGETQVYRLRSEMGMLQNSVIVTREANPQVILPKFTNMTMVAPETVASTGILPPPGTPGQ